MQAGNEAAIAAEAKTSGKKKKKKKKDDLEPEPGGATLSSVELVKALRTRIRVVTDRMQNAESNFHKQFRQLADKGTLSRDKLAVAEENLNIRRKRPPRELTRDAVERALNEQVAGAKVRCLLGLDALICSPLSAQSLEYNLGTYEVWLCAQHSIRMLGGVLDACEKELARLKICREKLEEDIDQVSQAYPTCLSHQPCAEGSI